MLRKIFGNLLFWILWVPFYLMGLILIPIALIFANRESEYLCPALWLWDTKIGINGDIDWVISCNEDVLLAPDPTAACKHLAHWKSGDERTYKKRIKWLICHNPNSNLKRLLVGS